MVEKAMGKAVVGRDAEDVVKEFGAALTVETSESEAIG
jgi:hypothetical protein